MSSCLCVAKSALISNTYPLLFPFSTLPLHLNSQYLPELNMLNSVFISSAILLQH